MLIETSEIYFHEKRNLLVYFLKQTLPCSGNFHVNQIVSSLERFNYNKTSIQWTPGSQLYLNTKKQFFGQKLFLNKKNQISCHKHHLHWFAANYLTKASCEVAASSLKDFLSKGRKVHKTHKLCIINMLCYNMLINPSKYNFLEKNVFDLQVNRVHPVQISSRSDNCITTHRM